MQVKFLHVLFCLIMLGLNVGQAFAGTRPKLSWPPPAQDRPVHVSLDAAEDPAFIKVTRDAWPYRQPQSTNQPADRTISIKLKPDEDAIIRLPDDHVLSLAGVNISYGRHVRLIGGALKATRPADQHLRALLRFGGQSGSVFVEGVTLDAAHQYGLDGLDVGGLLHVPDAIADIYVQNCRIENTYSKTNGLHADAFQFYGPVRWTRMDRVSIESDYQGLFLDPQADIGGIDLRRVDLRYADPDHGEGYIFFLRTEYPNTRRPAVRLRDVYVDEARNRRPWEEYAVYPPLSRRAGLRLKSDHAYFPAFPEVDGYITKGRPPGGPWVKKNEAGLNYQSPGYNKND